MSSRSLQLKPNIENYIKQIFSPKNNFLDQLQAEAASDGFADISIAPEQLTFLQQLVYMTKPKCLLEIGSLAGYSALGMALAFSEDAHLTTVDVSPKSVYFINEKAKEAGLQDNVTAILSDGRRFLESIPDDYSPDLVFLDADKLSYSYYFNILLPKMKSGGIIVADNAFAFGYITDSSDAPPSKMVDIEAMRSFNKLVAECSEVISTIIPLGDGLLLAVKK